MPAEILEMIKWMGIISCIGGWAVFLIHYLLKDDKIGRK